MTYSITNSLPRWIAYLTWGSMKITAIQLRNEHRVCYTLYKIRYTTHALSASHIHAHQILVLQHDKFTQFNHTITTYFHINPAEIPCCQRQSRHHRQSDITHSKGYHMTYIPRFQFWKMCWLQSNSLVHLHSNWHMLPIHLIYASIKIHIGPFHVAVKMHRHECGTKGNLGTQDPVVLKIVHLMYIESNAFSNSREWYDILWSWRIWISWDSWVLCVWRSGGDFRDFRYVSTLWTLWLLNHVGNLVYCVLVFVCLQIMVYDAFGTRGIITQ